MQSTFFGTITDESVNLFECFELRDSRFLFAGSGRVDNKKELGSYLNTASISDYELLGLAYLKWGKDAPNYILGDWSFAVFDTFEKELFIARDHHGYTAIYYMQHGNTFHFSSNINYLLNLKSKKLNERKLVQKICHWQTHLNNEETDFEGVYTLLAGHNLSFKNGKLKVSKYWFPENVSPRHYKNQQDYFEELREIFKEAVACRLIGEKPVAAMLSGGLDSGSVASMAAYILKTEKSPLTTFSHVPLFRDKVSNNAKNRFSDETDYILATAGFHTNINPILLNSDYISPITGIKTFLEVNEEMIHGASNAYWMVDIFKSASEAGFGAILSGENGNGAWSNAGLTYLLPFTHPFYLHHPKRLIRKLVDPIYTRFKNNGNDAGYAENFLQNSFVNNHILEKYDILEYNSQNNRGLGSNKFNSAKHAMLNLIELARFGRCANGGNVSNYFNIEMRDPTADVRLLEYCLSIPNEVFISDKGVKRNVVRQTMSGIMSPKTLNEKRIGLQSADILFRLLKHSEEVDETLVTLSKNSAFCYMYDIDRILHFWEHLKSSQSGSTIQVHSLTRAIMTGLFFDRNGF